MLLDGELAVPVDVGAGIVFVGPRFGVSVCEANGRLRSAGPGSWLSENPLEWKHVCAADFD